MSDMGILDRDHELDIWDLLPQLLNAIRHSASLVSSGLA